MDSPSMATRRRILQGGSLLGATLASGCGMFETRGGDDSVRTPTPDSGGEGTDGGGDDSGSADTGQVVIPEHFHEVAAVETATSDGLAVGVFYSEPDLYWQVQDEGETELVEPPSDASLQLLVWVWDPESGVVLQDAEVTAVISKDGETVQETSLVALLNQRTGLHWAGNVSLETYGEYDLALQVETKRARYAPALADGVSGSATVDITLPFERGSLGEIRTVYLDQEGNRGAVKPMSTDDVPLSVQPTPSEHPGDVVGDATSGAAQERVVHVPPDHNPLGDDTPFLAVSLRTPFNEYALPGAELTGTLTRDGETVFDGPLAAIIDGAMGYQYGASVPAIESGDELAVRVETPPAVARFDGYEQAFLECPDRTIQLE